MTSYPGPYPPRTTTIAIVRMLGKAVKFRHCPATVSALRPAAVSSAGVEPSRNRRFSAFLIPLEIFSGKVAGAGASQETGPWRFQPACVPRGTKELAC